MMRALAAFIVGGPFKAVLVVVFCTLASFALPPVTSILSYAGAAALGLYTLHLGARHGALVLVAAALVTGGLIELMQQPGIAVVVASLLLWIPVWLAAAVLAASRSLALAMLAATALLMLAVLLVFLLLGDPEQWWLAQLGALAEALARQSGVDRAQLDAFSAELAPLMTGALAAGLNFATLGCLVLGRWWQSVLVKPGALRGEFHALRLNRTVSLLATAIVLAAMWDIPLVGALARQWSLIVMVPFLFVGLAVVHATLANLKAARGWLIGVYLLIGLLPQALLMVVLTGVVDPWLDLRRRTANTETN
jgi:hypothetical protein